MLKTLENQEIFHQFFAFVPGKCICWYRLGPKGRVPFWYLLGNMCCWMNWIDHRWNVFMDCNLWIMLLCGRKKIRHDEEAEVSREKTFEEGEYLRMEKGAWSSWSLCHAALSCHWTGWLQKVGLNFFFPSSVCFFSSVKLEHCEWGSERLTFRVFISKNLI